ncbi:MULTISPECIES: hypothetical protein [Corynebacterium]|uniref:Secreted protein n=1 Tax=Corynebacterium flavescens TaxID=28028 RepID=A0A1L7CMV2_CORFL|nr:MULTISPECIES: hypothetical protein [Corynebacterium]APT87170.1 hypothetical protein CFLV_08150 [Corynebacterium flavescens]KAA8721407.1 hypothetical protein F4V60_07980 [Corynebacterium flavescens]MDN6100418.1 hypothetical protein [Corynebacterium flavescens]MDN6237235.1 hypothetical protein [Corynebacterium flavescens]MDN6430949.1 hypothetical protein [Corynebacterium flavescens]
MFRVQTLVILSALALSGGALAGCSYEKPGPPVEQPVGLTLDAPRVSVIDAGRGEKRVLEFKDIDSEQKLDYSFAQGFQQDLFNSTAAAAFKASSVDDPKVTLPLQASVEAASEAVEGQLPATRNAFVTSGVPTYSGEEDLSSAEGFQFGWRAEDSGQMSSLRLAAPQGASDNARQVVEQAVTQLSSFPVVFPTEEIGEGARWTVDSRVAGESTLLQTTTYTLNSLEGDKAQLGVSVQQRPSLGALSFEGTAQGTELADKELKVLDSHTESTGELSIDLTQPLPVEGSVAFDTKVIYGTDDSDLRVVQSTNTALDFAPAAS